LSTSLLKKIFLEEFLLISLGAGAAFTQTYKLITSQFPNFEYPMFLICGTWLFYQGHRYISSKIQKWKGYPNFSSAPNRLSFYLSIPVAILLIGCAIEIGLINLLPLIPAYIVAALYLIPAFSNRQRLRDLGIFKIFYITFVWTWVTAFWPTYLFVLEGSMEWLNLLAFNLERGMFIFALTIPFDIRDLALDGKEKLVTIPGTLGIIQAKKISIIALILHIFLLGWLLHIFQYPYIMIAILATFSILPAYLILSSTKDSKDSHFSGWIDGTILIEAVLLIAISYINYT
jgi:4-hydroxybenzoate polyprenyltransferase